MNTEKNNTQLPQSSVSKSVFKYLELKDNSTTGTIERVGINILSKKELKYFLSLEIVNENYTINYEECEIEQVEIYDNGWHILRKHLNIQFPKKIIKTEKELIKDRPITYR